VIILPTAIVDEKLPVGKGLNTESTISSFLSWASERLNLFRDFIQRSREKQSIQRIQLRDCSIPRYRFGCQEFERRRNL